MVKSNRINAVNDLNRWINKVAPLVMNRIGEGYQLKTNGELYSRDKRDIYAIIRQDKPEFGRTWIKCDEFRLLIGFDIRYEDGMGWVYIKDHVYCVFHLSEKEVVEFEPRPIRTPRQVAQAESLVAQLETDKRKIQDKINRTQNDFRNFITD